MKKLFLAAALLTFSLGAFATEIIPFSLYVSKVSGSKKLVLNLENFSANTVRCDIKTQEGSLVFTDYINTSLQKARKYDLSSLKLGTYTFTVDDLLKVEDLTIIVTESDILVNKNESEITYKPVVWLNKNKTADFNLLALGKPVSVVITDSNNTEIHSEFFNKRATIAKVYDFKKLDRGTYTMAVTVNGKTFYKYLTI